MEAKKQVKSCFAPLLYVGASLLAADIFCQAVLHVWRMMVMGKGW